MSACPPPFAGVKALAFDVLGTLVDWRTGVTNALHARLDQLNLQAPSSTNVSPASSTPLSSRELAARMAHEWRKQYFAFTRSFDPDRQPWGSADQCLRQGLPAVLALADVATPLGRGADEDQLCLMWHGLPPWEDVGRGLEMLEAAGYVSATLSNADVAMLEDIRRMGDLRLHKLLSAENFGVYKPAPAVYRGAAEALNLKENEIAMVAAHLSDLAAARDCGYRTIYIERPGEESWAADEKRYEEARGWVDMWVSLEEGGLLTAAERLRSFTE